MRFAHVTGDAFRIVIRWRRIPRPGEQHFANKHICTARQFNQVFHQVRNEQQLRPGGFGLLMTRVMVDELIYNEAHNEVVFVKYLT